MKIIRARLEYEDGILFQVLDPQTKETELVGEATIVKYITTGRMKNATLVHKEGSVPFIRVSGGKNISHQQKMPVGTNKDEQAEIARERQWFASKAKASAPTTSSAQKLVKQGDSYIYGEYVLTPCQNAFNRKKSYWLSKKDFMLAVYCFTPIDRSDLTNKGILEHIKGTIPLLEKAGFKK